MPFPTRPSISPGRPTLRSLTTYDSQRTPYIIGFILLATLYTLAYFKNAAVPSPHGRFPAGWWGWFDQSKYLASARAMAHGDFSPAAHWYPFGYALIGAPFAWMGDHLYFLPDLACLLVTAAAFFSVARRLDIPAPVSVALFLLGTLWTSEIRQVWAEPWNTTPACALIWTAFALSARLTFSRDATLTARQRHTGFLIFGMVLAFIPVNRPTDALLAGGIAIATLGTALRDRSFRWSELASASAGALLILASCGALWLTIYGPHPSAYMTMSQGLGFRREGLWWKAYLLFVTPRPWFPDGAGMLERMHWVFFSVTGAIALPLIARRPIDRLLILMALLATAYALLFFSYVDLIPTGLWRYNNIHYFKWMLPACALLAWYALRALFSPQKRTMAAIMAAVFLVSCIRLLPKANPAYTDPIWMVTLQEPTPSWAETYFGDIALHDAVGTERNIHEFRAIPSDHGERWIALSRPFKAPITLLPPLNKSAPRTNWGMKTTFRLDPCWLPPHACGRKEPSP